MSRVIIISFLIVFIGTVLGINLEEEKFNGYSLSEMIKANEKAVSHFFKGKDLVVAEILYKNWVNGDWVNDQKLISSTDENGYFLSILYHTWMNEDWLEFMLVEYTVNEFGWPIVMTMQSWDEINQVWVIEAIFTTTYNNNGQPTYTLVQVNVSGTLMDISRRTYSYDSDILQEILTEECEIGSSTWENDDLTLYTWVGEDNTERLRKSWENGSEWIDDELQTFTYDENHHLMEWLDQGWNLIIWQNQRHSAYTYDNDWNEIEDYERECFGDDWFDYHMKYQTWENGVLIERLTKVSSTNRDWVNLEIELYTYENTNIEEIEVISSSFENYPNPFNPTTKISFTLTKNLQNARLKIFNSKGELVKTLIDSPLSSGNYSFEFNGSELQSGVYFVQFTNGKNLLTSSKLVLLK